MGDHEIPFTDPDDPGFDPEALPVGPRPTTETTQPGLFGDDAPPEEDEQPAPPSDMDGPARRGWRWHSSGRWRS